MAMILSTKCSSSSSPTIPFRSFSTSLVYSHSGSCSRIQKPLHNVSFSSAEGRRHENGQRLRTNFQAIPKAVINGADTETSIDNVIGSLLTPKPTTLLVKEVLHMNGGTGDTSYTNNSSIQEKGMMNVKFTLEENVRDLFNSTKPHCLKFADLGCSSGPNAFSPLRDIIETINQECVKTSEAPPTIQAYLNDLSGNDFNNLFNLLSSFQTEIEEVGFGPCYISAQPGSFHGRLFPDDSIHFFHSSFAINWLSQVPKRLVSENGTQLNKGNICMAKTSPSSVQGAYSNQFESDFSNFLKARSRELKRGGRMVIAMMGSNDNRGPTIWELLGMTINDMVSQGLVHETTLDSFNIPLHSPCREEVRSVLQKEGSFRLLRLETFRLNWDGDAMVKNSKKRLDNVERGKQMSMTLRAAGESVIEAHFGREITDSLFSRHSKKVKEYLNCVGEGMWTNHVISLIKD